jgi:O-antigen ligase
MFAAGCSLVVVNLVAVFGLGAARAGIVWTVNDLVEPVAGPNEAAVGLLVLWALLGARHALRPSWGQRAMMALILFMLALTQSRSGLLAFATFLVLSLRRFRWRWLLGVAIVLSLLPLTVPAAYWERLMRSFTFERGSFEVFGLLVRLYDFQAAWRVFVDHPLTGVGYLGYRFVSAGYNELGLVLNTAENYFLETLVGLGVVGFAALLLMLQRLYALGNAVQGTAPSGTLAHELARRHVPLLTALLVANMTGDVFVGLVPLGQLALWAALLVRAGHLAVPRTEAA